MIKDLATVCICCRRCLAESRRAYSKCSRRFNDEKPSNCVTVVDGLSQRVGEHTVKIPVESMIKDLATALLLSKVSPRE